jgi:sec-independent protein translocase protein TatA
MLFDNAVLRKVRLGISVWRLGMFGMGTTEIIIVAVVIILIFGVNKIPQLGKGLGEGIRNFKSSIKAVQEDPEEKPKTDKQDKQ